MKEMLSIAGMAIFSLAAILLLRQYKPEYAFGVSVAAGLLFFLYILTPLRDVFGELERWMTFSNAQKEHYAILLQCFGIGMITKLTMQTCQDFGENSLAGKVDLMGKISILITALPLFSEWLDLIKTWVGL